MRLTKVLKPSLIKKYFQYLRAKGTKESSIKRKQAALAKFIAFAQDTYGINKTTIKKATSPRARLSENLLLIREKMYPNFFTWYLPLLLLTLLGTAMGIAVYRQFFSNANSPLAYPSSLTAPARILSFQGRLTDDSDNPINSSTDFVFRLYTVETDGTPVWTSNTCNVTPDQDGIFSFRLGATSGSNACGPAIGEDVFTANNGVWLEVEVNSEVLDNRQPIASSAYALNAETLQGFPPASPATASTVPIIDSSGDLLIGASNPDIVSSSGTFTLTGEVLSLTSSGTDVGEGGITLQAADTSDASITLNPDGTGVVDMIFEGTAPDTGYGGFVNATNASLTSGSLYYGEVASNATGYNMLEFQAGETPSEKLVFQIADGLEGRLGINNSSPAQALDIVGNATASGNLTAGGQIQTGRFISAPTAIGEGALYYNPTDSNIYMYDGSQWVDLTDTGSTLSESEVEEYIYDSDNTLSGAWSVAFGANSGTFDLTGTGDFVIASSSTPFATFDSTGFFQLDNIKLDGNTISATNDSGLALYDNASNGIFIKDGGNVGIGTTDPNYPLSISAIDKTRALNIISTNSTTSSINGIYLDITQEDTIANPSTNGIFGYITSNDLTANATGISLNVTSSRDAYGTYMNVTSNTASVGPSSPNIIGGYYSVYGASQTRGLTIDSNAWGTASPAYGIEIYTRSNSGETYGLISNTYGATQDLSYAGYFDNSSTNITTNEINKYGVYITSTGNYTGSDGAATNNYGLFIATPTGADNNYTAVFEGGNVGIGTTAPDSELSVVGAIEVFGNAEGILLTNNIADATTFLSGGYPLNDVTSIGATTSGDYFMGSYRAGSGGSFGTSSLGSYEGWVGFSYDVNDPLGTGYGTGLRVYNTSFATINVGGAEVARFDYAGNVGIGTTAPAYSLDIAGNASASGNLMAGGQVQVGRFVSEPTTIGNGAIYFNESDGNLYVYDGAGWVDLTGGGSALNEAEIEAYIYDNDNTLAGAWSVAFGNNSGTFDLTGSGDFVISDNSTPFATFADDGTFTLDNIKLDGNTIAATNDSGLALYDNASNGIFIEDGGNVGIGTTDPATKLEIGIASGNTQVEALRLDTTSSAANMGTYLAFHGLYSADQARIVGFREGTSNLGNLSFWTRDDNTTISEKMRIEGGADGNVGIGTTDPGTILHIATPNQWNSTLKLEGTYNGSNETNIQLKRTLGANPIADWGTIGNIFFTSVDSGLNEQDYMWLQGGIADNTDLTEDGFFKFWLMKGGSSAEVFSLFPDESVFNDGSLDIDFRVESDDDENALFVEGSTGNVGIGTTDPRVKLEVNGYIYASRLADKDGTDWYIDPALAEANAVGAAIYGRVGIGTSNPQAGLEILKDSVDFIKASNSAGTASFIVNSEGNVGIGTTSPSGKLSLYDATGTDLNMQYGGDQRWWITADTASLLKIGGIGSTRPSTGAINIHSSGNVGIGTASPTLKLDVDGGVYLRSDAQTQRSYFPPLNNQDGDGVFLKSNSLFDNQSASAGVFLKRLAFNDAPGTANDLTEKVGLWLGGYYDNSGTGLPIYLGGYLFSTDTPAVTIQANGNVGIGTTSPGAKLDVLNTGAAGSALVDFRGTSEVYTGTQGTMTYNPAGTLLKLTTIEGASVGKLGALITFNAYNNTNATGAFFGAAAGDTMNGPAHLVFGRRTGAYTMAETMRIDQNGNVVIGTTSPSGSLKLDVEGQVGATEYCDANGNNCSNPSYSWRQYNISLSGYSNTLWYPVTFESGPATTAEVHHFTIGGKTAGGTDPYNNNTLIGYARGGGWSDRHPIVNVTLRRYATNENTIYGIYEGAQNFYGIVIYLRGGQDYTVHSPSTVTLRTSNYSSGGSTFNAGVATPAGTNINSIMSLHDKGDGNYANMGAMFEGDLYVTGQNVYGDSDMLWLGANTSTTANIELYANNIYTDAATHSFRSQNGTVSYATLNSSSLSVTGEIIASSIVRANNNNGMTFDGGDDAALYDVNIQNTLGIYGQQDSTEGAIKLGSDDHVRIQSNSTSWFLGGNVGIGDSTPEGKLTITGGNSSSTTPQLVLNGGTSGTVGDLYILDSMNSQSGIGYAAKAIGVNIQNKVDANNRVVQRTTSGGITGAAAIYLGADDANQGGFGVLTSPQGSGAGTVLTERLTVRGNGNVGIGTTNPGANKLYVNGNTYVNGNLISYTSLYAYYSDSQKIRIHHNSSATYVDFHGGAIYYRDEGSSNRYIFYDNGNAQADISWTTFSPYLSYNYTEISKTKADYSLGDVVSLKDNERWTVTSASDLNRKSVYGVVVHPEGFISIPKEMKDEVKNGGEKYEGTNTGTNIESFENVIPIAHLGEASTKVMLAPEKEIKNGTQLTTSPIKGFATLAENSGATLGKALEPSKHWNNRNCQLANNLSSINWPEDDGTNSAKPCFRVPVSSFDKTVKDKLIAEYDLSPSDFIYVGKIMTFVNVSWYDPDVYLTDVGDIKINGIDENNYLVEKDGSTIDRIGLFSKLFVGEIKSGLTEATKIISDTLIATNIISEEKVISPIVETNEIAIGSETDKLEVKNTSKETIMEVADDGTTTHFGDLIVKNDLGEEVAKVDTQGNAEFNGKVTALEMETENLVAQEATFSTVYADNIIADGGSFKDIMADKIAAVRAELERIVSTGTATSSGDTITGTSLYAQAQEWPISPDESATAQSLDDIEDLGITGRLSSNEAFIYESLIVDNLVLTQQSLSSLDGILMLQPQGVGKIDLLAGIMIIEDNGNVTINGNLAVTGSLVANEYRGIDGNFNVNLASNDQEIESGFGMLNVYGQDGQLVASVDQTGNADFAGDLTASGSASFAKLNIESEEVAPVIAADSGFGELAASSAQISTNASAGSGSIAAGHTQIEILTDKVNSESLIYVTPTSDTLNQVLFIKQKGEGQFTVGIRQAVEEEIEFNWWVIN